MAKKKRRRRRRLLRAKRAALPVSLSAPPVVDIGRTVEVKVKKVSAESIVLTLSDGTSLLLKPVIMGIARSAKMYNPLGEPIYQINVGLMIQTKVPPRLKRKQR